MRRINPGRAIVAGSVLLLQATIVCALDTPGRLLEQADTAMARGEHARAIELYTPLAAQGQPDAMLALGILIGNGWGTELNVSASEDWLQKARLAWEQAARTDDPRALASLGILYSAGVGVPANAITAKRYFSLAAKHALPLAEAGDATAQTLLGSLYLSGKGVTRDRFRSVAWLERGAASGNRKSIRLLMHVFRCDCKGFPPEPERVKQLQLQLEKGKAGSELQQQTE